MRNPNITFEVLLTNEGILLVCDGSDDVKTIKLILFEDEDSLANITDAALKQVMDQVNEQTREVIAQYVKKVFGR